MHGIRSIIFVAFSLVMGSGRHIQLRDLVDLFAIHVASFFQEDPLVPLVKVRNIRFSRTLTTALDGDRSCLILSSALLTCG